MSLKAKNKIIKNLELSSSALSCTHTSDFAMSSRSQEYASKSDVDSLSELSDKLAADLRRHIRCIASFPILSDSWCDMADTLGRIATVSEAEAKLPKESDTATLWETEEGE